MINSSSINHLLDAIMPPSHNHRTWIGKIPKGFQTKFLGYFFGDVVLMISESDKTICELRKANHGYISFKGTKYEVRAKFFLDKPMLSKFDCASPHARAAIISLMNDHRHTKKRG